MRTPLPFPIVIRRWAQWREQRGGQPVAVAEDASRLVTLVRRQGWRDPADVTPMAIDSWRAVGGRRGTFRLLAACLRFAAHRLDQTVDPRSLANPFPPARPRPPRPLLEPGDWLRLRHAAAAEGQASVCLLHLLGVYGHRPVSLARLRVGDLERRGAGCWLTLMVKGGWRIRHPLAADIGRALARLAGDRPSLAYLFHAPAGGPWWDQAVRRAGRSRMPKWFTRLARRAGVHASIGDLKRRAITRMLAAGLDLPTIASFTGHRTLHVLLRYAVTNETRRQQALRRFDPARPRHHRG